MKKQYRIALRGGKWYPQVRFKTWLFWGEWQRISRHVDGYGLYSYFDWSHGDETKYQAQCVVDDFDIWSTKEKNTKPHYYYSCAQKLSPTGH